MFRVAYSALTPSLSGQKLGAAFTRFWAAQTISLAGSAITSIGLPLTAVLLLAASPGQLGMLVAAQQLPVFLLSLFAGVLVDRFSRRSLIVITDISLAALVGSIPIFVVFGALTLDYLYICSFFIGSLSVISRLAKTAYLPSILPSADLLKGNARLQFSQSLAGVAGPAMAGAIVQLLTAPISLAIDALSFVISALLVSMNRESKASVTTLRRPSMQDDLLEGARFVKGNAVLSTLIGASVFATLGAFMQQAVLIIYLTKILALPPATIGLIYASLGIAAVVGALLANRCAEYFGKRLTVVAGTLIPGIGMLLIPLAIKTAIPVVILILAQILIGVGASLYYVTDAAVRQAVTPEILLGRVSSIRSFVAGSFSPLGALIGGCIGELYGVGLSLYSGAILMVFSSIWLIRSANEWKYI